MYGYSVVRGAAALMLAALLMAPGAGAAQEAAVSVNEKAKSECLIAGGQLLEIPCAMQVTSPYGTQSVVLRSAPSDSYDAVAMLLVGQELTVIGEAEGFCFVLLADGGMGWLASDEVK